MDNTQIKIVQAPGADGSAPESQTVETGTVISLPGKGGLAKGTDIFAGWNENAGGSGTSCSVGTSVMVAKNMVFYAQWLDSSTPQYTVTYYANGASGTAPQAQTVDPETVITMNGGTISNNTCFYQGGGVAIYNESIFTMHGGIISGNKQIAGGSGTWVRGGGGVYAGTGSTFTKTSAPGSNTSGVIYGAVGPVELINTVENRQNGGGDAVLAYNRGKRDQTLGEYDEISTTNLNHGWE